MITSLSLPNNPSFYEIGMHILRGFSLVNFVNGAVAKNRQIRI
jgi:hypothetical protein